MGMKNLNTNSIIGIVIGLIMIAILLPIGLVEFVSPDSWMYNSTDSIWTVAENGDTLQTLILVLIPLFVVLGIIIKLIPKQSAK